jgi:uncharacterized protein
MSFMSFGRKALFAGLLMPALLLPAKAQEIAESHLAAARSAITAIKATDQFDAILPRVAETLRGELLRKDPNLVEQINTVVNDKTVLLAGRRADLETEAARAYARVFSEDELNGIATFYTSAAGIKLLADGPIVVRELVKAANIWQQGIARDLATEVGKELRALVPVTAPATDGTAVPATDGTAAEPAPKQGG